MSIILLLGHRDTLHLYVKTIILIIQIITVTNAIGKLFNKILDMRLENVLEKRKLINVCQIGFKRKARPSAICLF